MSIEVRIEDLSNESYLRGITDGIKAGRLIENEEIRINILSRVIDLASCNKNDNCAEFADLIESYIDEWLDGETE
jgi:hypothetical protein